MATDAFPKRLRKLLIVAGIAAAGLILLGLASRLSAIQWDGSFRHAEYQFAFKDKAGKPLSGVCLRVEDKAGRVSYDYPVTDFRADDDLQSDINGVLAFHHVGGGLEFGGQCWELFFLIPLGKCSGPVYYCKFVRNGKVVSSIRYNDLDKDYPNTCEDWERWEKLPRVKRIPDDLRLNAAEVKPDHLEFPMVFREVVVMQE